MPDPRAEDVAERASGRLYLPELDGLRFVAFLMVFLFHQGVPYGTVSSLLGKTAARSFQDNGWTGVQLFFILSGYLITTLLLREEEMFGRIDLKAFWIRRILRIWPLFYLTVILAFLVIPGFEGGLFTTGSRAYLARHLPWFLIFAGNWSMAIQGPVGTDAQSILWSVCVEEQFYLVVPLIIAFVARRVRIPLVIVAMGLSIGFRAMLARANANQLMIQFNTFAQFDTLLSGVLLALCLGTNPRGSRVAPWLGWLQWPLYAVALWGFSRANLAHGEAWRRTWDFVGIWAVGVGIIAVAVTVPGGLRWVLARPRLVWLGKISYGLYMYHEIAIGLKSWLTNAVGWFPFDNYILPAIALGTTVGLAWVSYDWFESRFLRLKGRWTRVPSRPV